ncbi:MAG: hypothetical protein F7C35_03995 [Desulfurococcales archaeon]|nr:hypothetical protein [Desulfurococcales archaeon]
MSARKLAPRDSRIVLALGRTAIVLALAVLAVPGLKSGLVRGDPWTPLSYILLGVGSALAIIPYQGSDRSRIRLAGIIIVVLAAYIGVMLGEPEVGIRSSLVISVASIGLGLLLGGPEGHALLASPSPVLAGFIASRVYPGLSGVEGLGLLVVSLAPLIPDSLRGMSEGRLTALSSIIVSLISASALIVSGKPFLLRLSLLTIALGALAAYSEVVENMAGIGFSAFIGMIAGIASYKYTHDLTTMAVVTVVLSLALAPIAAPAENRSRRLLSLLVLTTVLLSTLSVLPGKTAGGGGLVTPDSIDVSVSNSNLTVKLSGAPAERYDEILAAVENLSQAVEGVGDRSVTRLILEGRVIALPQLNGIIENATIIDLETGSNVSALITNASNFLLLNLSNPAIVSYAVGEENGTYLLRASINVKGLLIPWTLTNGETISPVHNVLIVNFSSPMEFKVETLNGAYTIHIYSAVIASPRLLGGKGNITSTPLGSLMSEAVIGVRKGEIWLPSGSIIGIPLDVGVEGYNLWVARAQLQKSNPEASKAIQALPELVLQRGQPSPPTAVVAKYVEADLEVNRSRASCRANVYAGSAECTCTYMVKSRRMISAEIASIDPPRLTYREMVNVSYLRLKLLEGSPRDPYTLLASAALVAGENGSVGELLLAYRYADVMDNVSNIAIPLHTVQDYPFYSLGGLSPWLVLAAALVWVRGEPAINLGAHREGEADRGGAGNGQ